MAPKRMDFNKRTFFILSGISNPLGSTLAWEFCRRFKPGSLILLIDEDEEQLQAVKKELQQLTEEDLTIAVGAVDAWSLANHDFYQKLLVAAKDLCPNDIDFELIYIVHNEGYAATHKLMEPQDTNAWIAYVQQHLYSPVSLNQALFHCPQLAGIEKLVINITSSLQVQPLSYNKLLCSSQKARNMYFRCMASEELRHNVTVLSYAPGIFETHLPEQDLNNNFIDVADLDVDAKKLAIPRIKSLQSTSKLINILQETSFISGHDVDYYDTYFL